MKILKASSYYGDNENPGLVILVSGKVIDLFLSSKFNIVFTRESINGKMFITDTLDRGWLVQLGWFCLEITGGIKE